MAKWVWVYGGFPSQLGVWAAPQDGVESFGGVGRAREALVVSNGAGRQQWPNWPERVKTASSLCLTTKGAREGWCEAASVHGGARGPPIIAHPSRFAAAVDKLAGDRHSVDRAMWRRRALEDEAADELEPLQGAAGERWWLGGADRGRVHCRAAVAASSWPVGGVARAGWRVLERGRVCGVALQ